YRWYSNGERETPTTAKTGGSRRSRDRSRTRRRWLQPTDRFRRADWRDEEVRAQPHRTGVRARWKRKTGRAVSRHRRPDGRNRWRTGVARDRPASEFREERHVLPPLQRTTHSKNAEALLAQRGAFRISDREKWR